MPEKEYKRIAEKYSEGNTVFIRRVAEYFNVSVEAASYRGKWLGTLILVENSILKKYNHITIDIDNQQEYISQDSEDDGENVLLFFSFHISSIFPYKTVNYY